MSVIKDICKFKWIINSKLMKYITFPTENLNEIIDLNNKIFIQE